MGRPLNMLLLILVVACAVSFWFAQGRPVPEFFNFGDRLEQYSSPPVPEAPLDSVHLRILNGTEEAGLAGEIALLVTRLGCVVEGVGNAAPWPGGSSVLVNRRLTGPVAEALAGRLGGIPVLKEWDGRTTEDAVLVLGTDYQEIQDALTAVGR